MRTPLARLTQVAVMAAGAAVVMITVKFPIVPAAPFLKYDPSDVVALLAGFWVGPGSGVLVVLLKDVLIWLLRGGNPLRLVADFAAGGTFVGVAAWALARWAAGRGIEGPGAGRAAGGVRPLPAAALPAMVVAILAGTAARVAVMAVANFPILYLEAGMTPDRVAALMWPAIVPFNALKGLLNGAFALVLSAALVRRRAVAALSR